MKPGTCKHFTGIRNKVCAIGVAYSGFDGLPCFTDNKAHGQCDKYAEPTAEELAADKAESDAAHAETMRKIAAATPKNKTESYNVWFDETAPGEEFTHEQFMTRLREVYGIDTKTTKGTRSMVCHMDGIRGIPTCSNGRSLGRSSPNPRATTAAARMPGCGAIDPSPWQR